MRKREHEAQSFSHLKTKISWEGTLTQRKKKILILDTSAFIAGFDPLLVKEEQYSVPITENELVAKSLPWIRFKAAAESGKLKLKKPKTRFLNKVKESSKAVGDVLYLSEVDLQVLALALEQKGAGHNPLIVTDDYSIQNVANQIGVSFTSLTTFGIRYRLNWILYCPACHRKYPSDYKPRTCQICGTKLKRKPLKKTPITR